MCKKENPIPGKIIAVTNRSLCERPFLEQIKRVCETKPAALILREKDLPETEYEEMARQVLAICEEYGVICILHSYIETAKRLERQYVHLPLPLLRTCMQKTENEEKQIKFIRYIEQYGIIPIPINEKEKNITYKEYIKKITS